MKKITKILFGIFAIIAFLSLTILVDFLLLGKEREEPILFLGAKGEVGTLAGGVSVSYLVHTPSYSFHVDLFDFSKIDIGDSLKLNVSPIYNMVNHYQLVGKIKVSNRPTMQLMTSLIAPLLTISLFIAYYFLKDVPQITWATGVVSLITLALFCYSMLV